METRRIIDTKFKKGAIAFALFCGFGFSEASNPINRIWGIISAEKINKEHITFPNFSPLSINETEKVKLIFKATEIRKVNFVSYKKEEQFLKLTLSKTRSNRASGIVFNIKKYIIICR